MCRFVDYLEERSLECKVAGGIGFKIRLDLYFRVSFFTFPTIPKLIDFFDHFNY